MRAAHITRRQAEAMTDGFEFDDVSAVQEAVSMRFEREDVRRSAEVDRLLQEVEYKLVASERIAGARQRVNATDQEPRSRRRADRVQLRLLPTRLTAAPLADAEDLAA